MLNLKDKIAVVSGCGSIGSGFGNGRAISTLLARQGAKVFGTDVNEEAGQNTGNFIKEEGNDFTLSTEVMKEHIPDYLNHYSFDRSNQQKNFIHVYSEGLNEEAIKKIHSLHANLNDQIQNILVKKCG